MDRRNLLAAGLAGSLLPVAAAVRAAPAGYVRPDASIRLWPGEAPGLTNLALDDNVVERGKPGGPPDRYMESPDRRVPRQEAQRRGDADHAGRRIFAGRARQGGI